MKDLDNFDAEFFGGKVCTQVVNEKLSSILTDSYGCCVDDGCFDTCNPSYCSSLGGILYNGIDTGLAMKCASNPCNSMDRSDQTRVGACCRSGTCIGTLTQYDCERNGGSWKEVGTDCTNYSCSNDRLIGTINSPNSQPKTSSLNGAQFVCSKPTPKKYYGGAGTDAGYWNGTIGPTYGREPVIVELVNDAGQCISRGGVVSATDGDINKGIMWGGCQFKRKGEPWKCESNTFEGCAGLGGSWINVCTDDAVRCKYR